MRQPLFKSIVYTFMSKIHFSRAGMIPVMMAAMEKKVREVGMAFIGPSVLAVCAALTPDGRRRSDLLREAEEILDTGCVSHNYIYFARTAIDLSLQNRDWDAVERYVTRLETYTQEQSLEWCDLIIARGRALAAWGKGIRDHDLRLELKHLAGQTETAGLKLLMSELNKAVQGS